MGALGALSRDDFLGGALQIDQPETGYRAGSDPVLLAASIPAQRGQRILDLGCGGGIAALCLGRRVAGLHLTGVELQPDYAALAQHNAALNDLQMDVVCADLTKLPADIKQRQFDHVLANPPYFDRARGKPALDSGRETGLGERTPLADWVHIAAKRLAPGGMAHMIHKPERLPELLSAMHRYLGSVEVLPFSARRGRAAHLVLIRAKKDGRADFCLHAPLVVHTGREHSEISKDYNILVEAALRNGAALPFEATP